MLRSKVLNQVLEQALTNGVYVAILLNSDGSVVSFASTKSLPLEGELSPKMFAAISVNIQNTYERCIRILDKSMSLSKKDATPIVSRLMCVCEDGNVLLVSSPEIRMYICLVSDDNSNLGALYKKADGLVEYLSSPLQRFKIS